MMGDVFLTVPRRFSSLFASAHVIGLWLGINQSATALDGVSAAPGKHMLHMCWKSLVVNLFFRKSPDSIHLNWGGFPKCLFIALSHHHQSCIIFENGQMVARISCIDRRAQHGRHVPTLVGRPVRYWQICDVFTRNVNWTRCTKI